MWEGKPNRPKPTQSKTFGLRPVRKESLEPWAKEKAPRRDVAKSGCYSSFICRRGLFLPSKDFFRDSIK